MSAAAANCGPQAPQLPRAECHLSCRASAPDNIYRRRVNRLQVPGAPDAGDTARTCRRRIGRAIYLTSIAASMVLRRRAAAAAGPGSG